MKTILPLGKPAIRAYSNHAHVFSILSVNSEQYLPWIYNYYVQLYIPADYEEFNIDYLIPSIFVYSPNLFVSRIERNVAINIKSNVIDSLKYFLDSGYYIYTLLEVKQISAYPRDYVRTHDPLLYGYDDEKEVVYFADTYQRGKYAYGLATYKEIIKAIGTNEQWKEWNATTRVMDVVCLKYKDLDVRFKFNKEMFKTLIQDYLEQRDSYHLYWGVQGWTKGPVSQYIYGIGIYSFAEKYIAIEKEKKNGLDIRGFYVIWEHKIVIKGALDYLWGQKWIEKFPEVWTKLKKILDHANIMMNLCLKYNVTCKSDILYKLEQCITEMCVKEKVFFSMLVNILEVI